MYQRVSVDKCAAQLTDVVLTEDGSHLREQPLDSSTRSAISFTIATCPAAIHRLFMSSFGRVATGEKKYKRTITSNQLL